MKTTKLLVLAILAGLSVSACHTVAGAGTDISRTGDAVTDTAHKTTPRNP